MTPDGWHPGARRALSPNQDGRPAGCAVELLVVHGISLPPGVFGGPEIEELFLNRTRDAGLAGLRVSAHFLLRRDGEMVQFVSSLQRAWHAGASCWDGREACNDFSIGVELEGTDTDAYEDSQYRSLQALIADLRAAHPELGSVAGHCHIAPERKTDPGPAFDWDRLFAAVGAELDGRRRGGGAAGA